jgi:hypothetical protein
VSPAYSGLCNIALANPKDFSINKSNYFVSRGQNNSAGSVTSFMITGVASNSQLFSGDQSRQINILPSKATWPRIVGVIAGVTKQKRLYFNTSPCTLIVMWPAISTQNIAMFAGIGGPWEL